MPRMAKSVQPSTLKWPNAAGRSNERGQGAGDRADESIDFGNRFQRGIGENVDDQGQRGKHHRQAIDEPREFRQPQRAEHEPGNDRFLQRQAARDERADLGPAHQGVGFALEGLVEYR